MSKYEDRMVDIKNDDTFDMTRSEIAGARVALQWLDQNVDRVPGRTITESEVTEVFEASKSGRGGTRTALVRQGVTVVPDPEPTNVELLAELIREIGYDIRHNGRLSGSNALALDLDARGVKASGGDNDGR